MSRKRLPEDDPALTDEEWVRHVRENEHGLMKAVLDVQWDLIQSGFGRGDGAAKKCFNEAIKRVRKEGP